MLGLGNTLRKASGALSSYVRDGLKLYMPYNSPKEVKFVGQGSTYFLHSESDYIDVGNDSSIQMGTSDFSICAWIKKGRDSENSVVLGNGRDDGTRWFFRIDDSNKLEMYSNDGTGTSLISNGTITGIAWNHVALSWDRDSATGAKLYINGILDAERDGTPEAGTLTNASYGILIGARRTTSSTIAQYWNGYIKNVAIWERALSATEIQNVMYKTYADLSGTLSSGLKAWWALEGNYLDSTSNDNDGTNNGSTANTSLYGGITPLIPRGVDNAPVVQADAIGTGYATFNGSSDYINVGSSIQSTFNNSFTLMAWIKSDVGDPSTQADTIMGTINSSGEDNIYLRLATDQKIELVYFGNNDSVSSKTTTAVFDAGETEWTHVSVTMTNPNTGSSTIGNDQILFYINGVLTASSAGGGGADDISEANFEAYSSSDDFAIGARNDANDGAADDFWDGKLKNVSVWSSALTQAQIQSIMEKTYSELTSSEKTNLVSWWGLDTNANDEHGSNNGTLS